jgi:hypothetical protein
MLLVCFESSGGWTLEPLLAVVTNEVVGLAGKLLDAFDLWS